MSLNWDFTKCKDSEALGEAEEWPITHALIWLTMGTGIGDISEKNAPEFYARIHLLEEIDGKWLRFATHFDAENQADEWEDRPITPEDVQKRIGLSTNVFPMETRAKWLSRVGKRKLDENVRKYEKALEDASPKLTDQTEAAAGAK